MAEAISPELISVGPCCKCRTPMAIPSELYKSAKRSSNVLFYCAYGHAQCFAEGPSEADELRRERDRLKQQLAAKDDALAMDRRTIAAWKETAGTYERRLNATKGVVTKMRKRISAGACPCCNRSFSNLERHMRSKHAGWLAEPIEEETP